jgi:hypothetical protein
MGDAFRFIAKQNKTKGLNGACGEHAAQNWQLSRVIVH